MNPNPFKPTAGKRPPILIGRESVIEDFEEGLDNGAGAPGRLILITGNRGCGKTVLLRELQRLASERGWAVVSDSASLGLCDRLADALRSNKPVVTSMEFGPSFGRMSVEAARAKGETPQETRSRQGHTVCDRRGAIGVYRGTGGSCRSLSAGARRPGCHGIAR